MRSARTCSPVLVGVLLAAALPACGLFDDDDGAVSTEATTSTAEPEDERAGGEGPEAAGTYAVGTRSVTFVDETRETLAIRESPAQPTRTVVTDLWYPAEGDPATAATADAPAADGSFPVIVFSHGQQGRPDQYAPTFEHWAGAGYVVAAPQHPLTVAGGPIVFFAEDAAGDIGDVPFVISSLEDELGDLGDLDRLAVAGHSSGAIVAHVNGFDPCCHDERIDAVLLEALVSGVPAGPVSEDRPDVPVMFVHGTHDLLRPEGPHAIFEGSAPPRFFLTVEGGDHTEMYRSGPQAPAVAEASLAFFDLTLKGDDAAADRLAAVPGMEAVVG